MGRKIFLLALCFFVYGCTTLETNQNNSNEIASKEPPSPFIKEFNFSLKQTKEEIIRLYGNPDKIPYQELLKNGGMIEVLDYNKVMKKVYDQWWIIEVYRLTFKDNELVKIETCVPAAPVKIDK